MLTRILLGHFHATTFYKDISIDYMDIKTLNYFIPLFSQNSLDPTYFSTEQYNSKF